MLDQNFSSEELFRIMDNDPDFISFKVEVTPGEWFTFKGTQTVERNVEIIGTTFYAFAEPQYKHKTRVTYQLSGGGFQTSKAKALESAAYQAKKDKRFLNGLRVSVN